MLGFYCQNFNTVEFKLASLGAESKLTIKTFQATHSLDMKSFHAIKKRYEDLFKNGIVDKVNDQPK